MHRLGISLYPEHSNPQQDRAYMERAAQHGFSRIFTCLLSVKRNADETIEEFGSFVSTAHDLGFTVAVDTNEDVFERLGATPFDLSPFAHMGVDIIRLDGHFGDQGDIIITRNPQGIQVEFNASCNLALDLLIERGADPRAMTVCHNFFPEPYTGLSEEVFQARNAQYKRLGLTLAAFVSSREENTFGPWPVFAGLPTCEDDRRRPIDLQARHLLASGLVDDVIVGNCFASDDELAALAAVDTTRVTMRIDLVPDVTDIEREVIWGFDHTTRGDASAYMLRSSWSRLAFKERSIAPRPWPDTVFHRGDVLIPNDNMAHYRGELEVALRDFENDGTRNVVGRIPAEELFLLDYIAPEHPFGFIRP
ncbi:MupG family TIM beta-alpha barrel fold protein [Collinsella sp. An2]|uniref:DUF871 domain-containing protein n=1 Tax=Collinsella sp. An2 TaxID=1965585 RepID=UPI000B39850E|nr:MupG family TIM beta-alpha barrel fold protein [Collinsella sp. An2]OUP08450.1 cell surface protein [Collinsella sp. An2]